MALARLHNSPVVDIFACHRHSLHHARPCERNHVLQVVVVVDHVDVDIDDGSNRSALVYHVPAHPDHPDDPDRNDISN